MQYRESLNEYSCYVDHFELRPPRMRSPDYQSEHYPIQYDNLDEDDEMLFSDYIMSVKLPRGFKPLTDMEPYDRCTDP